MFKKSILRVTYLITMIAVLSLSSVSAAESEMKTIDVEEPDAKFSYIEAFTVSFKVASDGTVIGGSIIELQYGAGDSCKTTAYIQEYYNGQWRNVAVDSDTGISHASTDLRYNEVAGRDYRVVAYGYVYENGRQVEKFTLTKD